MKIHPPSTLTARCLLWLRENALGIGVCVIIPSLLILIARVEDDPPLPYFLWSILMYLTFSNLVVLLHGHHRIWRMTASVFVAVYYLWILAR